MTTGLVPITKASETSTRLNRLLASRWGAALVGTSDDAFWTIVLAALVGKTAMVALGLALIEIDPESIGGFSGRIVAFDREVAFGALVFAPVTESLLVWLCVWFLGSILHLRTSVTVVLTGLFHMALHGLVVFSFCVFPVFALHALILKNYRDRGRRWGGLAVLIGAHALTNGIGLALFAVQDNPDLS